MPTTESRYIPVVNIIAGTVAGVFLTKLVTTNLGRWCADSARWASSGRHVDHRDRRRVMISM